MQYTVRGGLASSCEGNVCKTRDYTSTILSPNTIPSPDDTTYVCAVNDGCMARGSEEWLPGPAMDPPEPVHTPASPPAVSLQERQICMPGGGCAQLEGDGFPHQWIFHKQLSGKYECGDNTCSISPDQQISYPVSADWGGAGEWIDGDFAVTEKLDTGTLEGCVGPAGGFACVFAEIWHTDVSRQSTLAFFDIELLTTTLVHGARRRAEPMRQERLRAE